MKKNDLLEIIEKVRRTERSAFFFTPPVFKGAVSYFFPAPDNSVSLAECKNIRDLFTRAGSFLDKGYIGYSLIEYEAGLRLDKKLIPLADVDNPPVCRFNFYKSANMVVIDSDTILFESAESYLKQNHVRVKNFRLNTSKKDYAKAVNTIKNFIGEGETYQMNFTVKGKFVTAFDAGKLFLNMIFNQSAEYSALINDNNRFIISVSPELFFRKEAGSLLTRPMKGTITRGINYNEDRRQAAKLKKSEKDRAENVMIVDLLRNDAGKISEYGSVKINSLFKIEKYESLHQMTSEIESKLRDDSLASIFKSLFPCGSVTGAPKIRTMQLINILEKEPRGIYTGSVGILLKDKTVFNVAIRTLSLNKKNGEGEIGLGSGIVWDSDPAEEYKEVSLKGKFLTHPVRYFELFESMLYENGSLFMLNEHLVRLRSAASFFNFVFDKRKIIDLIEKGCAGLPADKKFKLKVTLSKWNTVRLYVDQIEFNDGPVKVLISPFRTDSKNRFQYFKTTNRRLYDNERRQALKLGFGETIFLNERNEITEGSITNIFIRKGGKLLTPPTEAGILNGIYRAYVLQSVKNTFEKSVFIDDLRGADEIFLVNSVRKKIEVESVHYEGAEIFARGPQ